jgi:hypothetical protein
MRSELLPVARISNESNEIGRFAAFFGDQVPAENAPEATKVCKTPFLCRMRMSRNWRSRKFATSEGFRAVRGVRSLAGSVTRGDPASRRWHHVVEANTTETHGRPREGH